MIKNKSVTFCKKLRMSPPLTQLETSNFAILKRISSMIKLILACLKEPLVKIIINFSEILQKNKIRSNIINLIRNII